MPVDLTDSNVESVALAAVTLVGGLWTWMDRGVLDDEHSLNVEQRSYVRLARLALRVVDAGDLSSRMIGWAMNPGGVWPIPKDYVAHDQPAVAVATLAEAIAASPECRFSFSPYVPHPPPKRKRFGLWAAIKLFYARLWAHLRGMPGEALARLRDKVETSIDQYVQARTFGADSEIVVRIGQRPANATELSDGINRITLLGQLREVTIPAPQPSPDTWRMVRSVAFGAADGGDFAGTLKGHEPEWQQQRAVIDDRHLIAPDPGEPDSTLAFVIEPHEMHAVALPAQAEAHLRAFDVLSVKLFADALHAAEKAEVEDIDDEDKTDDGEDADDDAGEHLLETRLFVLASLRERFDAWMAPRQPTMLWQLGVRLTDGVSAALADLETASAAFERLQTEQETQDREWAVLRRKLRRRTIFAAIVLGIILASAAISAMFVALTTGLLIAAAGVLVASLIPVLFFRTAKRLVQLEYKLRDLESLPHRIISQRRHNAHEVARLTYLNEQLIDWGEIISMVLHRPWGPTAADLGAEPWHGRSGSHVFTGGTPSIDQMTLQGEILRLRKHLTRVGWLSAVYTQALAAWEQRYATITASIAGVSTDPSSDAATGRRPIDTMHGSGEPIYRPRPQLKEDLVHGRFADELRHERVDALRKEIDSAHSSLVLGPIQCDLEDLNGQCPSEFLRPIVDQTPIPDFTRFIRHVVGGKPRTAEFAVVGVSQSLGSVTTDDTTSRRHLPISGVSERFVLAAVRADFSAAVELEDIACADIDTRDGCCDMPDNRAVVDEDIVG